MTVKPVGMVEEFMKTVIITWLWDVTSKLGFMEKVASGGTFSPTKNTLISKKNLMKSCKANPKTKLSTIFSKLPNLIIFKELTI